MSKHQAIINYIGTIASGTKISVRTIASVLEVSEGTAYRAIKDARTWELLVRFLELELLKLIK